MIALVLKRPKVGLTISFLAAIFNLLPSIGDQAHLLHSAPTPGPMLILEILNAVFAVLLVIFAFYNTRANTPKKS
jgi:hypothetical protein